MRFDAYGATISASPDEVIQHLAAVLGARDETTRGMHAFEHTAELVRGGSVVCRVLYGGNGGADPHVMVQGAATDSVVDAVRARWPEHRVSRADAAQDYDERGAWERLTGYLHAFAGARGMVPGRIGPAEGYVSTRGTTLYLGSAKSDVQLRVYQKGLQLRERAEKAGQPVDDISPDLVRVELRVRLRKGAKVRGASMSPEDFYGFAVWSREFLAGLAGIDVDRVTIQDARQSDAMRSIGWMTRQYASAWERLCDEVGETAAWEILRVGFRHERDRRAS